MRKVAEIYTVSGTTGQLFPMCRYRFTLNRPGFVAQSEERTAVNRVVAGSSPAGPSNLLSIKKRSCMNRYWHVNASFNRNEERVKVSAYGPAPRIYEALGSAKGAIAKAYPDAEVDNIDITSVEETDFVDKDWRVYQKIR